MLVGEKKKESKKKEKKKEWMNELILQFLNL